MVGFGLAGVILLALIIKFPFFEYGPRYAAATGRSLVDGYRDIGAWALWLFSGLAVVTAVVHSAALLLFTAFLFQQAFGLTAPLPLVGVVLYILCGTLLRAGRFRGFDLLVKLLVAVLAISTLAAAAVARCRGSSSSSLAGK